MDGMEFYGRRRPGEEKGSKRRQWPMAIVRARMLPAASTCHVENPLFRVTDFRRQQRKLSAQGSFSGCTLTFCVMSGGHVCGDYGFLFKSAAFCSVPRTIFFIGPTVLLPCESFF